MHFNVNIELIRIIFIKYKIKKGIKNMFACHENLSNVQPFGRVLQVPGNPFLRVFNKNLKILLCVSNNNL